VVIDNEDSLKTQLNILEDNDKTDEEKSAARTEL